MEKKSTTVSEERHLESTGYWNGAATFQYEHGSKLMGGQGNMNIVEGKLAKKSEDFQVQ